MSAREAVRRSWAAEAASVPEARRFVREHLAAWELAGLAPNAELLVTELAGNVVLHVGGTLEVSARLEADDLVIEVRDQSPVTPLLRAFSSTSSTGRGMRLVHSLAAEHGVRLHDGGKTIWVRLNAETSARDEQDLAQAFADVDWLAQLEDTGDLDGPVTALLLAA